MIPVGYIAKHIALRPEWLKSDRVNDIYSVSNCVSKDFADYIDYGKYNGYWLFDSPDTIRSLAREHAVDINGTKLFFYEAYELEYDEYEKSWAPFAAESSLDTLVVPPVAMELEGYDVVTFSGGNIPECSPLSCNSLAAEIETNEHCLLPTLETAQALLEQGKFEGCEPGPYRFFSVHSVQWS